MLWGQTYLWKIKEVGIPDTPEYILYTDEDKNDTKFPDLDEEITSEVGDEYVHALVMLLLGSQMMCGTIRACKRDLDGNSIGCQLENSILDTQLYDI